MELRTLGAVPTVTHLCAVRQGKSKDGARLERLGFRCGRSLRTEPGVRPLRKVGGTYRPRMDISALSGRRLLPRSPGLYSLSRGAADRSAPRVGGVAIRSS